MAKAVDRKFDPDWDLVYLINLDQYKYMVINKPQPVPGFVPEGVKEEDVDPHWVYVREGITIHSDGRWYYWKLRQPIEYDRFKNISGLTPSFPVEGGRWGEMFNEDRTYTPDFIFTNRINNGKGTVGHPAPRITPRHEGDNNWIGFDDGLSPPLAEIVPDYVLSEDLDDLILAPLMLSEYLQEGVENPKLSKKAG
jgi:hypothetical protein